MPTTRTPPSIGRSAGSFSTNKRSSVRVVHRTTARIEGVVHALMTTRRLARDARESKEVKAIAYSGRLDHPILSILPRRRVGARRADTDSLGRLRMSCGIGPSACGATCWRMSSRWGTCWRQMRQTKAVAGAPCWRESALAAERLRWSADLEGARAEATAAKDAQALAEQRLAD